MFLLVVYRLDLGAKIHGPVRRMKEDDLIGQAMTDRLERLMYSRFVRDTEFR